MKECLLWEGAKALGKDRGLVLHGECPVNSICEGPICVFVSPPEDFGPQQLEKFYSKLEKHFKEQDRKALEVLRLQIIKEG